MEHTEQIVFNFYNLIIANKTIKPKQLLKVIRGAKFDNESKARVIIYFDLNNNFREKDSFNHDEIKNLVEELYLKAFDINSYILINVNLLNYKYITEEEYIKRLLDKSIHEEEYLTQEQKESFINSSKELESIKF